MGSLVISEGTTKIILRACDGVFLSPIKELNPIIRAVIEGGAVLVEGPRTDKWDGERLRGNGVIVFQCGVWSRMQGTGRCIYCW